MLEKARNEMGELAYMVPVKELTGTVTFRHLLRFSQKGQFVLPPARYVRSYAPAQQSVAAGSEWTGMQGEISELAQNRLAIGVGYSANACGGDAVITGAARCAARSTVSAVVIRRDQSLSIT